jgi:hypothetical protein
MSETTGLPLTIGEARMVAEKGRRSSPVDPGYWSWIIDQLCDMVEAKGQALTNLPQGSPLTPDRLEEIRRADARFGDIDASDHSVILQRRDLLAALDHALARADESEAWCARLANDRDCDKSLIEVGVAKAVAVIEEAIKTDDGRAHRALCVLRNDVLTACAGAPLPPHERTLAEHRRMREALEKITTLGEGRGSFSSVSLEATRIAREAIKGV